MSNAIVAPTTIQYGPYIEYVMSASMAEYLLNARGGDDKKKRPHDYLVKVVNEDMGILGTCVKVSIH